MFQPRHTNPRLALIVAAGALLAAACGSPRPPAGGPDTVVLIVIDTLRADRIGCMGSEQAVTPTLDRLAREGVLFRQAMTTVPVTLPAIASLMTGRWPHHHGVRDNAGFFVGGQELTLAERFEQRGWRTGAVVGSAVIEAETGLEQGFEVYRDEFEPPYPVYDPQYESSRETAAYDRRRATEVTDLAIEVLEGFGDDPGFLFVHYFDVHAVYDPPPRFARMHPGRPYDGEVSYVDAEIGRLLAAMDGRDPLVVAVSDHGEGLGEHGEATHGFLLYQSTLHVPVLVKGPGVPSGVVRDDPISLVDLEPTIAAVLDLGEAAVRRDGVVLDWSARTPPDRVLYAETFRTLLSYDWSELRAARRESKKTIVGPWTESYDLQTDPHELHALERDHSALLEPLARIVAEDPPKAVLAAKQEVDPARREELASLGYVGGSEPTLREERPHPIDMLGQMNRRLQRKDRYENLNDMIHRGQLESALGLLEAEIEADPSEPFPHHLAGLILDRQGKVEASRASMRRALEIDPAHLASLNWLAQSHVRAGDLPGALPWFEQLLAAQPDDPTALYNLGLAEHRLGQTDAARPHLQRFLELAPDDARAAAVRQLLDGN